MQKEVICQNCGKQMIITNLQKYQGKKVALRCKNSDCKAIINLDFSNYTSLQDTVILNQARRVSSTKLVQYQNDIVINEFVLLNQEYIVGRRNKENNGLFVIPVNDPFVSKNHFRLKQYRLNSGSEINYTIKDLGSKNKTLLNEKLLNEDEELFLKQDDIIKIGNVHFKYVDED